MVKGTPSMGKKSSGKLHIMCRRCGNKSYHMKRSICASCGYGKTAKTKSFSFIKKKK